MTFLDNPRYIAACADLLEIGCAVRDCMTAGQAYAIVRGPGPCAGSELVTSYAGFKSVYTQLTGRPFESVQVQA